MTEVYSQWHAKLTLGFSLQNGSRSVLSTRVHEGPLLIQRALYPEGPEICHVAILHPPSGIAGGDMLDIQVRLAEHTRATITTPGATRWYKSNGRHAAQNVLIQVGAGAQLDWLPCENIYFEQVDAAARNRIELHPDSAAIGWEISQLGSVRTPGHWLEGRVVMDTQLYIGQELVWVDAGELAADDALRQGICGLDGLPVHATLWAYGTVLDTAELEVLNERLGWGPELRGGLTVMPQEGGKALYLLRAIGLHAEDVRGLLVQAWQHLRPRLLRTSAQPLRLWTT
ncbi:urease accessory protein UreD [Alcaligenes sp. Marseille-Q7550]|nr:urease accessory protein UreD [Escherichia coli]